MTPRSLQRSPLPLAGEGRVRASLVQRCVRTRSALAPTFPHPPCGRPLPQAGEVNAFDYGTRALRLTLTQDHAAENQHGRRNHRHVGTFAEQQPAPRDAEDRHQIRRRRGARCDRRAGSGGRTASTQRRCRARRAASRRSTKSTGIGVAGHVAMRVARHQASRSSACRRRRRPAADRRASAASG